MGTLINLGKSLSVVANTLKHASISGIVLVLHLLRTREAMAEVLGAQKWKSCCFSRLFDCVACSTCFVLKSLVSIHFGDFQCGPSPTKRGGLVHSLVEMNN